MAAIRTLHEKAMDLAEQALAARRDGDDARQLRLYRRAFELERQAAEAAIAAGGAEPTRSILLRSAASLALMCHELRESERLIAIALAGEPPEELAEELRDLFDQVRAARREEALRAV